MAKILGVHSKIASTSWTAYTPTITGWTTITGVAFFWARVGDVLYIKGTFTGTTSSGALVSISLPGTNVLDASKIPTGTATTTGPSATYGQITPNTANPQRGQTVLAPATNNAVVYFAGNAAPLVPQTVSAFSSGVLNAVEINAIPILGWSALDIVAATP